VRDGEGGPLLFLKERKVKEISRHVYDVVQFVCSLLNILGKISMLFACKSEGAEREKRKKREKEGKEEERKREGEQFPLTLYLALFH
jgi:hypothetical protein